MRPEFKIVAGRMFQPGKREMIVGVGAQAMFQHMQIGDKVILPDGEWPIVGVFTTGDLLEGQLLGDTETLMTALHKTNYNSVLVRLASPDSLDTFKKALTTNPGFVGDGGCAIPTGTSGSADQQTFALALLGYVVGAVMAIGALFGCLNTMYAAVCDPGPRDRHLARAGLWRLSRGGVGDPGSDAAVGGGRADRRRHRLGAV